MCFYVLCVYQMRITDWMSTARGEIQKWVELEAELKLWTTVESEPKINFGSATLVMLFSVAEPPPPIFFFKKLKYKHFRLLKF